MLVTRKINLFTFFFGKPQAADKVQASIISKAKTRKDTNLSDFDKWISIAKSEDLYKAQNSYVVNPYSQLNR